MVTPTHHDDAVGVPRISLHAFVAVTAVSCICAMLIFFIAFVNLKYREDRSLKMSSPNVNVLILLGSCMAMLSPVVVGISCITPSDPNQYLSQMWKLIQAAMWIEGIGFTIALGSMTAKTWRVARIFLQPPSSRRVNIKDEQLICMVGAAALCHCTLLSLWTAMDRDECQVVSSNETQFFNDISSENDTPSGHLVETSLLCGTQGSLYWLAGLWLYKMVVLCLLMRMAWKTRSISISPVDDASTYMMTSVVFILFSCFGILGAWLCKKNLDALFVVLSVSVFLPHLTTVLLHFLPKIKTLRAKSLPVSKEVTFFLKSNPQSSLSKEKDRLETENTLLKAEVQQSQQRLISAKRELKWMQNVSDSRTIVQIATRCNGRNITTAGISHSFRTHLDLRRCLSDTEIQIAASKNEVTAHALKLERMIQQEQKQRNCDPVNSEEKTSAQIVDCGFGCSYYSGSESTSTASFESEISDVYRKNCLKRHFKLICSEYAAGKPLCVPTVKYVDTYQRNSIGNSYNSKFTGASYFEIRQPSYHSIETIYSSFSSLPDNLQSSRAWYVTGTGITLV